MSAMRQMDRILTWMGYLFSVTTSGGEYKRPDALPCIYLTFTFPTSQYTRHLGRNAIFRITAVIFGFTNLTRIRLSKMIM